KANPDRALAATAGSGSHIAWAFVQNLTGTRAQFVPYRGAAPALQDIVAGHVDVMCTQALRKSSFWNRSGPKREAAPPNYLENTVPLSHSILFSSFAMTPLALPVP